jgi:hypothetical protein
MRQEEYREINGKERERERERESKERDRVKNRAINKVGTERHEDVSDW